MSTLLANVFELDAPRQLATRSQALDLSQLGPQEVAARTQVSVLSPGTELAAYRGDPPLRPGRTYPRVIGYCNVARVLAVGAKVQGPAVGDLILTTQSHRSAFVCPDSQVLARVPPELPPQEAALTYLFHLGLIALQKAGLSPDKTVGVIGLGILGLGTVALARHFGASVTAYTHQEEASALARAWGARVFRKDDVALEPQGVDILVTTSGSWKDWRLALAQTRKEGTIAVLGFPGRTEGPPPFNPLDSQFFYDQQLRILACGQASESEQRSNCAMLLELLRARKLPAGELLAGVVPWSQLGEVYERLSRRETVKTTALDWRLDGP